MEDFMFRLDKDAAIVEDLHTIDLKKQMHGKNNKRVNLPEASHRETEHQLMQTSFKPESETLDAACNEHICTTKQHSVYDTVVDAVTNNLPRAVMMDAPASICKTFAKEVIAARLRGQGEVVLIVVASTVIAALQLPDGWTAHSMIP